MTNTMAIHFVHLASLASRDFDLFLDRNVSAAPDMAPERPALFPDWNNTINMMVKADKSCRIVIGMVN